MICIKDFTVAKLSKIFSGWQAHQMDQLTKVSEKDPNRHEM